MNKRIFMKKILFLIFFLILVLSLFFISCSNNSSSNKDFDPNGIATKNNATDDMFGRTEKTNKLITVPNGYASYGWFRVDGTSGILGTWDYYTGAGPDLHDHLTFNADGTYTYIANNASYIDNISDIYKVYIENDVYHIIIWNGSRGYKNTYLASDNYLCFHKFPFN